MDAKPKHLSTTWHQRRVSIRHPLHPSITDVKVEEPDMMTSKNKRYIVFILDTREKNFCNLFIRNLGFENVFTNMDF